MPDLPPHIAAVPAGGGFFPGIANFDVVDTQAVGVGAAAVVVSYKIPSRQRGILAFFGQSVLNSDAWGNLTWQVRLSNSPIESLTFTTRVGLIAAPTPVYLAVGSSQTLDVLVTNAGAAIYAACARLKGYFWPVDNLPLGIPAEFAAGMR